MLQDALQYLEDQATVLHSRSSGVTIQLKLEAIEDFTALEVRGVDRDDTAMQVDANKSRTVKPVDVATSSRQGISEPPAPSTPTPSHVPDDLTALFPPLQRYAMVDIAPHNELRNKSERKSHREDPNKRAEDATYTKIVPVNKFMCVKPTLPGNVKPATHLKGGHWYPIEPTPVSADVEVPPARPIHETVCFELSRIHVFSSCYSLAVVALCENSHRRALQHVAGHHFDGQAHSLAVFGAL